MAHRFDRLDAPAWMHSKFEKTPEGFLRGRAVVTNTGVFPYVMADGSVVYELRLPEEVFAEESLDSLRLKPVTNDHPTELLTPENIKDHQVGNLGDNPSSPTSLEYNKGYQFYNSDSYYLSIDMVIQEKDAIADVESGKRELSCGYSCELEDAEPGARWCGIAYDKIQRKIRYNHVAIVDKARAGDAARIHLDSADAIQIHDSRKENPTMPEYKVIKLDGVDYTAESKVLEALHLAQTRADTAENTIATLTADKSKVEGERDSLKDKADGLEAKVKELEAKKMDEAQIAAAVARRVKILDAARQAEIEVKADMAEIDIQKAVIVKVFPKANLDGKDAVYIDARFDGAVETLSVKAEENADAANRELNSDEAHTDEAPKAVNADAARQKMIEAIKNGYQVEKK